MHQSIKSVSSVLSVGTGNIEPCEVSAALTMPTAKAPPHPTVTSNLRQGFYQAVKNLAGKHRAGAFAKYPELRAYTKS
jgi:hypothetical protein